MKVWRGLILVTLTILIVGVAAGDAGAGGGLFFVSEDEAAPETDAAHNSLEGADLTLMYAGFKGPGPDSLIIVLDYSSNWYNIHLMVALERNGDADGAPSDPFEFPVTYGHVLKPDYVFTYKYSANDYADLRKWNGGWEFWHLAQSRWITDPADAGKNALAMVTKTNSQVIFSFPADAIGEFLPGDTFRLQSYLTFEAWDDETQQMVKFNALDSNPHDLTHDMEPDEGEWWETATDPVTLSEYATYILPEYGVPPSLFFAAAFPDSAAPGDDVRFSVDVRDAGGGIGDVSVDLSSVGGDPETPLKDDGTGGDGTASDGVFSVLYTLPDRVGGGVHTLEFSARDSTNVMQSLTEGTLKILTVPELILTVADSVGDDHGPNQPGVSGLYYVYPTNRVFYAGAFDIHEVEMIVDGQYLVVRVHIGNLPASNQVGWGAPLPGATCTNPNSADLNLEKIDIYIDSEEGVGAQMGLPYRYVDIAEHDAWEYAVAIEGWWKGFVESNGSDNIGQWTLRTQTVIIDFCDDNVEDYIDVKIGLAALGSPTPEEILRWDFIVTMSGHDGDSSDDNFGAIRSVNAGTHEWQFGGGRNSSGGRDRDPNLIDVVAIPGQGKAAGRTQEEMLDYLTDEAWERYDLGYNSCRLEASFPSGGKGVILGTVALDGPPANVEVYVVNSLTGEIGGNGITTVPGGTGAFQILSIEDGTYYLIASARGYVAFDSLVTITGEEFIEVDIELAVARATRYAFIDSLGNEIYSEFVTVSLPDSGIFTYEDLLFEPRDDAGNSAILSGVEPDSVRVSVSLIDPSVPPRGEVVLAADAMGTELIDEFITSEMFEDGVGRFWVRDDSLEVLRIEVSKDLLAGAVELRVKELEPRKVSLTPDVTEIVVGGSERIELGVQLLDDVDNTIPVRNVTVRVVAVQGEPIVEPPVDDTDGNGFFKSSVYGYRAGTVRLTARSEDNIYKNLASDTIEVFFRPGPAASITASLDPIVADKGQNGTVTFQVVDAFGNAVAEPGVSIDLSTYPEGLLTSLETPVTTGATGLAEADFTAGNRYGFVSIEATSDYPVDPVVLSIAPTSLVAEDEAAPESDPAHNSDPGIDLTTMYATVHADTLNIALEFSTAWDGAHLMVVLERNRDHAGGEQDPFEFPIFYRHTFRPDYVFTYKYSGGDYADLRRWNGGWEFWHLANGTWITDPNDAGKDAKGMVEKLATLVWFKFPLAAIGGVSEGDTLRLEAYVTQEFEGSKYNALDSSPSDATHDMDPDEGEWWETATTPVTLSKYGLYIVPLLTTPPDLSDPSASPDSVSPGEIVTFSVTVEDAGSGVGDVFMDLTPLGGRSVTWLYDDGTHGDDAQLDGTYASRFTIPAGVSQGIHNVAFVARDSLNLATSTVSVPVTITTLPVPFISVRDSIGDDHGPNITDASGNPVAGLYYYYPTNGVFAEGVFDIEQVDLIIDGTWLAIKVHVGEVPSSEAVGWNAPYPGEKCTDPNKADLNLQKIDIYIDSEEGVGATSGLPNRNHDIARSDAWEYAVAIEGWWRGIVSSNGENATAFWTLSKLASSMYFCTDHVDNSIEISIALEALGLLQPGEDMTEERKAAIEREIKTWEFIITTASHDGDSSDENFGGIRWVNRSTGEWQFGGGRDGEGGRDRDPNIVDVVTVRDSLSLAGRPQEEMLNYDLPYAQKRFENLLNACVLEATFSEDISPPDITPFHRGRFGHSRWWVLQYSPASFWTLIVDESDIEEVQFRWRPEGQMSWNVTEMGHILEDYWIADIDPVELESATRPVTLVDGTVGRPFQAEIYARDEFGNEGRSELLTFAVAEDRLAFDDSINIKPGEAFIAYDGTFVLVPDTTLSEDYDEFDIRVTPLPEYGPGSVDLTNLRSSMDYMGVGRRIDVVGRSLEDTSMISKLDNSMIVALHYPSYKQSGRLDEQRIGLFRYNDLTERWIGMYGSVNDWGNAVRAEIDEPGTFGLFADSRLSYDSGKGLSGVTVEPNPFSPNGDGLYDETRINFYLAREIDWITIEIYDIAGQAVRTIRWQEGVTRLTRNEVYIDWDGKDDNGRVVPYGIYILRVEARFKVAPNLERENKAVVVIK
ncbi:MAG: glucodextranase DOMON-like domain-containing protein [Candidatus Eisenbacteria bacterium]